MLCLSRGCSEKATFCVKVCAVTFKNTHPWIVTSSHCVFTAPATDKKCGQENAHGYDITAQVVFHAVLP